MRFNSRELVQVAQQSANVEKEGVLYMKEKQDGIFKSREVYIDRFFRLKGNLLFYFKNKETKLEPLGVLVIERCTVELDLEEEASNSFVIVCEGEDNPFKFAAVSEEERDSWIQALHMASYECLKMQLQSLREQVQAKTGRDPVTMPDSSPSGLDLDVQTDNFRSKTKNTASEDPVLEISLSCSDLPCDSQGTPPNSLVVVHIIVPQQQQLWVHHNHTEIADKNNNPLFLKTIGFGDANGVDTSTRVRLTVYNVKERMTGTMAQLGQAIFTLQDVLMASDMSLTLSMQSHDIKSKGKITVMAWINDNKVSLQDLQEASSSSHPDAPAIEHPPREHRTLSSAHVRESLRVHFDNVIKRSFRFATNKESVSLQVHEYMAEFQHSFNIPEQLLRIWIDEEKQKNSLLQDLGELDPDGNAATKQARELSLSAINLYSHRWQQLSPRRGTSFKRSVEKDRAELEFVPVNLHLQRMAVSTDSRSSQGVIYDLITMGAPTAFNKKYKNGGLRRMLQQQHTSHTAESTLGPRTKLQRTCSLRNEATDLRVSIIKKCEGLPEIAQTGSGENLQAAMSSLSKKVTELVSLCKDSVLCSAAEMYVQAKRQSNVDGQDVAASLRNISTHSSSQSQQNTHRWSGSSFVKSPTTEPWEVTWLNLEAAVMCLMSQVEALTSHGSDPDPGDWREALGEGVAKLQTSVDIVSAKISLFLTFLTIMENKDNIQKMHEIKYRRDIVNSHAISALIAGVCAMLGHERFTSPRMMKQLLHCGLLVEVEGLLSCYGDEMGMIEDMAVGVEDLGFVRLQFSRAENEDDRDPVITMGSHIKDGAYPDFNRHTLDVQIPVQGELFDRLPEEIQRSHHIRVCPSLFNIGINEDATYAETRFGSTALQERINAENVARLYSYYEEVASLHQDTDEHAGGAESISNLLKLLRANVAAKKSKNVEVLHLAAEICERLGGVRITSCKSGKDRTSMGVTLEMIQILQRHHDLAPHVFTQALDCIRSVGCRRENTHKNTGVRKYAFNRFQMLYIPKLYRAPGGTYGNIIT
ncbi:inositol polyphosphate-4-phosphatase type I A-like isoform X1 [Littorina saxatilis]|uniref:inositol polyphosphate-4-phosphatase type I A-like isoform X1 n=1 Tax=Littorina saxatilis TaxID=31220 RepID=UPI0038B5B247